jgi:hypothetical protein
MKYPTVRSVFGKRPEWEPQSKENECLVGMTTAQSQHQHNDGKNSIEGSNRIEFASRNFRLLTFVSADRKDGLGGLRNAWAPRLAVYVGIFSVLPGKLPDFITSG